MLTANVAGTLTSQRSERVRTNVGERVRRTLKRDAHGLESKTDWGSSIYVPATLTTPNYTFRMSWLCGIISFYPMNLSYAALGRGASSS